MFAAISEARVGAANEVELEQAYMTAALSGEVKWTVIPAATSTWARNLGCQLGELELLLDQALRLDEPDPVESWRARVSELELRAAWITGAGFQALRLFGGGTDLELSLHRDTRWLTAAHSAPGASVSNLPTEEIFTSPDGGSATGTVRAAGPVVVGDTEVEDLILRFDRGRLIALSASAGQSSLENRLGTDAGASIVGEVALVDGGSRVGDLDVLFHNTLLDENAGCHIALGQGFPAARSSGAPPNQSAIHVDITLGCKELQVDAVDADGLTVTLLQEGRWLR
jgi:aminopeptidase